MNFVCSTDERNKSVRRDAKSMYQISGYTHVFYYYYYFFSTTFGRTPSEFFPDSIYTTFKSTLRPEQDSQLPTGVVVAAAAPTSPHSPVASAVLGAAACRSAIRSVGDLVIIFVFG